MASEQSDFGSYVDFNDLQLDLTAFDLDLDLGGVYGHERRQHVIPPTPGSLDFGTGAFHSPTVDEYMREEMMFTPLLSPAVTPLDQPTAYPATYFSPLTLPALDSSRASKRSAVAAFVGDSSSDSISPEPLSAESAMAPPPVPAKTAPIRRPAPVTPASLMSLNVANEEMPEKTEADAIIDTVRRRSQPEERRIKPRSRPGSVAASPTIKPRASSVVSPTLKPRISPHLKPLLPDGLESASATLATKSNYQNIVEGKHSQLGLSYPEQLSITLTSKRTSHKLAEQGRRNRINTALAELNQLLVDNINVPDEDDEEVVVPQQCSKANTVELAIEYIKKLQSRVDRLKVKLKEKGEVETDANMVSEKTDTDTKQAREIEMSSEANVI